MTTADPVGKLDLASVQRFGEAIADRVERWMPSPFLFAILLTYVVVDAAFTSEGSAVIEIALSCYGGFCALLQMMLLLIPFLAVVLFVLPY